MGHEAEIYGKQKKETYSASDDFVLEKGIFNNIFEKDIRRVFMYKKAERLAKALHLIAPAFAESPSLRSKIDAISVALVEAAILPPGASRSALSGELLTLSSILAIARTSGMLSAMNAELIRREVHFLLQEIAAYEEPRLQLDEVPTLSGIAKIAPQELVREGSLGQKPSVTQAATAPARAAAKESAAQASGTKDRREAVLSILQSKGQVSIKDISVMVRGVSEKTIQRELAALIAEGVVSKTGERRWSTYALVGA